MVLISGVVLLTYKKPEGKTRGRSGTVLASTPSRSAKGAAKDRKADSIEADDEPDEYPLDTRDADDRTPDVAWRIGDESDDEDVDELHSGVPLARKERNPPKVERRASVSRKDDSSSGTSTPQPAEDPFKSVLDDEEFGGWEDGTKKRT